MSKKVKVLLFFYLFQLIISSCVNCNCNNGHYNKIYDGVEVRAWDTSGFQNIEIIDETLVPKNGFGLSVNVNFKLEEIAKNDILKISSFGFSSAYACDCSPDVYDVKDPIVSMKIISINVDNDIENDVTTNFTTHNYSGDEVSISSLLENLEEWQDGFRFDLITEDNIPNVSIFKIIIYLESGTELVTETIPIHFEN